MQLNKTLKCLSRLLHAAFFLCFLSSIAKAESFGGIEVRGNKRIEQSAVIEKMALRPGMALSTEAVRRDIQSIFSLGFLSG
jgi:outer membrane protein assembly factor BamA